MMPIVPFYMNYYWSDDVTSTAGNQVYIYVDDFSTATTIPFFPDRPVGGEPEETPKAVVRIRRLEVLVARWEKNSGREKRPRTLQDWVRVARAPRPTIRRTATATKNFRRRR